MVGFTIASIAEREARPEVIESGFSTLVAPEAREGTSFEFPNGGWSDVLAQAAYAEGRDSTPILTMP